MIYNFRMKQFIGVILFSVIFQQVIAQQKELKSNIKAEVEQNLTQAKSLESSGDYNQASYYYNKAATTFWVNGFTNDAVSNFLKAVSMNEKIGNLNAIKTIYNNIGMVYTDVEDYSNALIYFEKSLSICKTLGRKPDITATLINIANIQSETGKYESAAKTIEEANNLARELNDIKLIRNTYSMLADVYSKMGDTQKSSEYYSLFTTFSRKIQRDELERKEAETRQLVNAAKDKVKEAEKEKQLTENELQEKQEKLERVEKISTEQQMQIDLLSKEKELQDAIIKNQKLARNIYIAIIIGILAFSAMVVYSYLGKKKANKLLADQNEEIAEQRDMIENKSLDLIMALGQIERQNKNITSSITYAHRIQQALLPESTNLKNFLPDSFILLLPRDIVSGDFYWYCGFTGKNTISKSQPKKNLITLGNINPDENGLIIAAADCTGHGVPGAFMSMIGFNLLETITRNGIIQPDEMLNELHLSIRQLLKQSDSDNRDGMDMAICTIKDKGRKVEFAGAINPLYYIKNNELYHVRGDFVPVGGLQKEEMRKFTLHTIEVNSPTSFYIFSDGFTDQFGGETGEKFSSKRFKELLLEIHNLPMQNQQEIISTRLEEWMGTKYKAIDDVLVIGFKLGENNVNIL